MLANPAQDHAPPPIPERNEQVQISFLLRAGTLNENTLPHLMAARQSIRRGQSLFRANDPCHALYIMHSGFFKTYAITTEGREQVNGFHMPGEVFGMDGLDNDRHHVFAVALEDSVVCVIPLDMLETWCSRKPERQRQMYRMLSREIVRNQQLGLLLGVRLAEEKVAAFMVDLSQRFYGRGYAAGEFILRMTRNEIGSYLGLKMETVSRVLSKFASFGLIRVRNKHIQILDIPGMTAIMHSGNAAPLQTLPGSGRQRASPAPPYAGNGTGVVVNMHPSAPPPCGV